MEDATLTNVGPSNILRNYSHFCAFLSPAGIEAMGGRGRVAGRVKRGHRSARNVELKKDR